MRNLLRWQDHFVSNLVCPMERMPSRYWVSMIPWGWLVNDGGQEPQSVSQTPTDLLFSLEQMLERIRLEVCTELQALQASNVLTSTLVKSQSFHPPTGPFDSQAQQQVLVPSGFVVLWLSGK